MGGSIPNYGGGYLGFSPVSEWLLVLVGIAYLVTAADLWQRGQGGMALTFISYAVGNLGLIIAVHGK